MCGVNRSRVLAFVVGISLVCSARAQTSPQERERAALAAELGWDPAEQLAAIGAPPGSEREAMQALQLCRLLGPQHELRLLRFGLGSADERVVAGAVVLMSRGDGLPVPELANAARLVVPRLADDGCPVTWGDASPLIGASDFAALVDVIGRMPAGDADTFLGNLHRMARADAMLPLLEMAKASDGEVRGQALANAMMVVAYGGAGPERLVATCLELAGRTFDPVADDGMPDMLRQALRVIVGDERYEMPFDACARWLAVSRAQPGDLPLLQELLERPFPMPEAAAWAIGAVPGDAAAKVLAGSKPAVVTEATWIAARARQGDAAALEQLLAGSDEQLAYGLALASPARRRAFFERLLTLNEDAALDAVQAIGEWVSGAASFGAWALPPCEQDVLAGVEELVARTEGVRSSLLRALVEHVPCCETVRMADKLLALPPSELMPDVEDVRFEPRRIGHGCVWAFLEVTRPDAFRAWLRRGFQGGGDGEARDLCAAMLIRLGDAAHAEALIEWSETAESWLVDEPLVQLARDRDPGVLELLRARSQDPDDAPLAALAVCMGVPYEYAESFGGLDRDEQFVREALLAGDVEAGFLAAQVDVNARAVDVLLAWNQPKVMRYLRTWRASTPSSVEELFLFDQAVELVSGDPARIARTLEPLTDGRYATHHALSSAAITRTVGLDLLPFLVGELGTNCCKAVFIEECLQDLFRAESGAFDRERLREPAAVYLRRTLLAVRHRLRYSRIVDAFVVAGE